MLTSIDLTIIALYALTLLAVALYVSRATPGHEINSEDYFLAGKSLPWWAIGASLIAANISPAEQIIGQSGQGFVVGLAIAAYEWQAAIVLIIVAKYFADFSGEEDLQCRNSSNCALARKSSRFWQFSGWCFTPPLI